ncbi:E3 ubiquitin-protein ligase MYLIP-like [Oscarella lobularis]|uniref:E3 ubiquitin-protein ligase MYLIP-like n=1 Tax=Oscarella lobularis TaxID=121494 RepID=UPI003313ED7A
MTSLSYIVAQPTCQNDAVQCFLPKNATGIDLLNKVCSVLGIVETDYFGLLYDVDAGEGKRKRSWLNLRNNIARQVDRRRGGGKDGSRALGPYMLELKVKFYVDPEQLIQEKTRLQFFYNLKELLRDGLFRFGNDRATLARAIALVDQAEEGRGTDYAPGEMIDRDTIAFIAKERVAARHMAPREAIDEFLRLVAGFSDYGAEIHRLKRTSDGFDEIRVGTDAIYTYKSKTCQKEILFYLRDIVYADCCGTGGSSFYAICSQNAGSTRKHTFRLDSRWAARRLNRSVTERHIFYARATIDYEEKPHYATLWDAVRSKFDPKCASRVRVYDYDVLRTCQEAFTTAWKRSNDVTTLPPLTQSFSPSPSHSSTTTKGSNEGAPALECRICMDRELNVVFCPCGHAVSCSVCARACVTCPICRAPIGHTQKLYLTMHTPTLT